MTTHSDEQLMLAYVDGDNKAFDALFERYAPILFRLLRAQLPSDADTQDIIQETFLHLHRARNDFKRDAMLRPWIFTIALNLRREYFRKLMRRKETPNDIEEHQLPPVEAADPVEKERSEKLYAALAKLPDDYREVIVLHWIQGMSFPEISEILGIGLSAVKVRAHRSYEKLRNLLGDM